MMYWNIGLNSKCSQQFEENENQRDIESNSDQYQEEDNQRIIKTDTDQYQEEDEDTG